MHEVQVIEMFGSDDEDINMVFEFQIFIFFSRSCSASHIILQNPRVHPLVHKTQPLVHILSQVQPIHILATYFLKHVLILFFIHDRISQVVNQHFYLCNMCPSNLILLSFFRLCNIWLRI